MLRRWHVCGVLAACAVAAAATLVAQAPQPTAPGGVLLEPLPMPEILKQYQSIPAERLKNPSRWRLADDPPHV